MTRRAIVALFIVVVAGRLCVAQREDPRELAAFESKVQQYVEMHGRLEGPLPPLKTTSDMDVVHQLMDTLRARIQTERKNRQQGYLLTPGMIAVVRARVSSRLTRDEIARAMEDIDEHTPPDMPPIRVNEALPQDAPFGLVPPLALGALPPLPSELRYVVLAKALIIWDHHADLVVDIAPGVFDAATYARLFLLISIASGPAGLNSGDPEEVLVGRSTRHIVTKGESLRSIGARLGWILRPSPPTTTSGCGRSFVAPFRILARRG
jgi:hypothetical protein